MNRYPLWKYLLLLAIIVPGLFYATPNIYGENPGVQIVGLRGFNVDLNTLQQTEAALGEAGIEWLHSSLELQGNVQSVRVHFKDPDTQLKARAVIRKELGDNYTTALALFPAVPDWFDSLSAAPMYLGLDLRGGVHFLMEVDIESALEKAQERYLTTIRSLLREEKIRFRTIPRASEGDLEFRFNDEAQRLEAQRLVRRELHNLQVDDTEREGQLLLSIKIRPEQVEQEQLLALQQNMKTLRNRIDELGVAEPIVQQQGLRRIVVQLPGVQDPNRARDIIGRTATLDIKLVDEEHDLVSALQGSVPPGSELKPMREGGQILLKKRLVYSGDNIIDAAAGFDQIQGGPVVHITLDGEGAEINKRVTGENVGNRMAVIFKEEKVENELDEDGNVRVDDQGQIIKNTIQIEEVITAPRIQEQLGARFQITGLSSIEEARDLALLLRAGALAAPMHIIEERTVGPSLGQDNIDQGFRSVVIGFVLVLIFMVVYYRLFGGVACSALLLNLVLIIAVLSALQATLTLPGVAGIVLTVGMAVDANVLIFERIREEIRNGNTPQASIHVGYDRALSTILDANITTLIAAIVLFNFGTGPIKGFAITLSIGIVTSMFTAIFGTRALVNLIYGGRKVKSLLI